MYNPTVKLSRNTFFLSYPTLFLRKYNLKLPLIIGIIIINMGKVPMPIFIDRLLKPGLLTVLQSNTQYPGYTRICLVSGPPSGDQRGLLFQILPRL